MTIENRCCFTGHRTLEVDFDRALLCSTIEELYDKKQVRTFICGGAVGFDMECAYAVLGLKRRHDDIKLCFFLPCLGQDSRWSMQDRRKYKQLLEMADFIDCPQIPYNSTVMKTRNYKMVDACQYVISYFNGRFISGTAQTIRYAKRKGREVINLGTYDLSEFR